MPTTFTQEKRAFSLRLFPAATDRIDLLMVTDLLLNVQVTEDDTGYPVQVNKTLDMDGRQVFCFTVRPDTTYPYTTTIS